MPTGAGVDLGTTSSVIAVREAAGRLLSTSQAIQGPQQALRAGGDQRATCCAKLADNLRLTAPLGGELAKGAGDQ
jgi:hypothetical protein